MVVRETLQGEKPNNAVFNNMVDSPSIKLDCAGRSPNILWLQNKIKKKRLRRGAVHEPQITPYLTLEVIYGTSTLAKLTTNQTQDHKILDLSNQQYIIFLNKNLKLRKLWGPCPFIPI